MGSANVVLKLTPSEFDIIRKALNTAADAEQQVQQNIKDEMKSPKLKSGAKVELVKAQKASEGREASIELLLERLR